jgi:hypothetical protein
MKKMLAIAVWFVGMGFSSLWAQSGQMGIGYNMMLPMSKMKNGWSSAHGIQFDFLFGLSKVPALKIGAEGQFSLYGYREETQDYPIFNGIVATSEVSFSSYIMSLGLKALVEPPKNMPVKPYAAFQFGVLGMTSDLTLDDFTHSDYYYCSTPNTKTLIDDYDWYAGGGAGLKFDLSPKKKPGLDFIDLYCGYIGGGTLKYANMNRMYAVPASSDKGRESIKVIFINSLTQEQQEMNVADVYRHPISMLQIQLKLTMAIGGSRKQ